MNGITSPRSSTPGSPVAPGDTVEMNFPLPDAYDEYLPLQTANGRLTLHRFGLEPEGDNPDPKTQDLHNLVQAQPLASSQWLQSIYSENPQDELWVSLQDMRTDSQSIMLGIYLNETSSLIGVIGIFFRTLSEWPLLHFMIAPDYRGQGYATDSIKAITDMWWRLPRSITPHYISSDCFAPIPWGEILIAEVLPDNRQAERLLQRASFLRGSADSVVEEVYGPSQDDQDPDRIPASTEQRSPHNPWYLYSEFQDLWVV